MSGVDFAAIQVGDKVKIRWGGLVSEDWMEVIAVSSGDWVEVYGWRAHQEPRRIEVIAHQPAPRKVEVTLGQPLPITPRHYWGTDDSEQTPGAYAAEQTERAIYLAVGMGPSTILGRGEARRLALDILATTGVEA